MPFRLLARLFARPPSADAVWRGAPGALVIRVGADGRILSACPGAEKRLGRRVKPGELFSTLFHENDRDRARGALAADDGRTGLRILSGRDEPQPVEIAVSREGGAFSVLILDAPAAETDASRPTREPPVNADLLADLSHEMRTPLNAVIGFADAMMRETFGPLGDKKYVEYARDIHASGAHLLDLVMSILDLAKIEADRFKLKREMSDIGEVARECAGIVRLSAEKAGLALNVDIAGDLRETWADPRAVRQILLNLLSNAVKFTSDGGVDLKVMQEDEAIIVTVADTGVGMSKAQLEKLGGRFTAAHELGVRGAKGAGLGLALAFALAELHEGSLRLDSAPGEGVTATLRLPVRTPARPKRRLKSVLGAGKDNAQQPEVLTQLERIEAYRRERQASAA